MSNHTIDNTENKIQTKRRGRPKGSGAPNTIQISLQDLLDKVDTHNIQTIIVSRTWLQKLGVSAPISSESTENKIEFTVS